MRGVSWKIRLRLTSARFDLEVRVLRGRTDQDHRAVLHPREQGVLLGLVPAVHLVDKQRRAPTVEVAVFLCRLDRLPQLFHPGQDRVHRDEVAPGGVGDDLREGRLSRARGAGEDER